MSELATLAALFAAFAGIIALLLFVATWLCIALAAGVLGDRKGRCGACWFVACLVAPPLILPLLACSYLRPSMTSTRSRNPRSVLDAPGTDAVRRRHVGTRQVRRLTLPPRRPESLCEPAPEMPPEPAPNDTRRRLVGLEAGLDPDAGFEAEHQPWPLPVTLENAGAARGLADERVPPGQELARPLAPSRSGPMRCASRSRSARRCAGRADAWSRPSGVGRGSPGRAGRRRTHAGRAWSIS